MNILVCVSRVPDTAAKIKVAGDNKSVETTGVKFILNPYDEYALEEAARTGPKYQTENEYIIWINGLLNPHL